MRACSADGDSAYDEAAVGARRYVQLGHVFLEIEARWLSPGLLADRVWVRGITGGGGGVAGGGGEVEEGVYREGTLA